MNNRPVSDTLAWLHNATANRAEAALPPLPQMWVGFVIALMVLLVELTAMFAAPRTDHAFSALTVFVALVGWCYWLYCIYEMHAALARVTSGAHAVSPGKAVGFSLIPLVNFVWPFRWARAIAAFANVRTPAETTHGILAAFVILVGFLAALWDASVGLALIFGASTYLNQRIKRSLTVRSASARMPIAPPSELPEDIVPAPCVPLQLKHAPGDLPESASSRAAAAAYAASPPNLPESKPGFAAGLPVVKTAPESLPESNSNLELPIAPPDVLQPSQSVAPLASPRPVFPIQPAPGEPAAAQSARPVVPVPAPSVTRSAPPTTTFPIQSGAAEATAAVTAQTAAERAAHAAAAESEPTAIRMRDRYRRLAVLGQGGMSRVYLAEAVHLGTHVALKENLQDDEEARSQFRREARILARLSHPNLPRVIDYFVDPLSGHDYLVMDYIEGEDLAAMVGRLGPLPEALVAFWIEQVLVALEYLHTQQPPIIHRDIKPSNIKITQGNKAVLVDFGIAKTQSEGGLTTLGAKGVTPGYAPPEQYGQHTDERSDIYALGATFYALLEGKTPPDATLRLAGHVTLPRPMLSQSHVAARSSQIILRAMELDAGKRWPSAQAMRAALVETTQPGRTEASTVRRVSNRAVIAVAVALALVLIALIILAAGVRGATPLVLAIPTVEIMHCCRESL